MIALANVTIAYGTGPRAVMAVRDFTLSVAEGEAVGLVGESGSGKTVLSRSIMSLLPGSGVNQSGSIRFVPGPA